MDQKESIKTSPSIANIVKALVLAKLKFGAIKKSSNNPYYKSKYADLEEILTAVTIPLAEEGIAILQGPALDISAKEVQVTTVLAHISGEFFEATISGPAEQKTDKGSRFDIQTEGSAISYLRRYAVQSLLCLAAEDDDGNGLVSHKEAQKISHAPQGDMLKKLPSSALQVQFDTVKVVDGGLESELDDGCPKNDEDVNKDPLPTPLELTQISKEFKALGQPSQQLKAWVEKHNNKGWKQISKVEFDKTLKFLKESKDIGELIKE